MSLLEDLKWRYVTKAYNPTKKVKQEDIGLGLALAQASELRIDSTPAEGFDNSLVDEVLELSKYGLKSVSLLYLGYRDNERDWLPLFRAYNVLP